MSANVAGADKEQAQETSAGAETAADRAVASVGLVEKKVWAFASPDEPFVLENRQTLPRVEVAYETYGALNKAKSNAVLVLHGLTGSSHAAGKYAPSNRSVGYWDALIGPGKVLDTRRFFVVSTNALGGCRGTTGPASESPLTGRPYGLTFPIVTIRDMVRVQERFLREGLGIENLALVAGGSMGGMQALEWGVHFGGRVRNLLPIAACARLGARGIAFNEIARRAICLDPKWRSGDYYDANDPPSAGLALARMVATITYLSEAVLGAQFGRKPAAEESALEHDLHARFDVERYLHDEGEALVRRFDANSYLYLTKALDLHDVSRGFPSLGAAIAEVRARTLLVAMSSDDLFPAYETEEVFRLLKEAGRSDARYFCLQSTYGHDAFLVEQRKMLPTLRNFVAGITV